VLGIWGKGSSRSLGLGLVVTLVFLFSRKALQSLAIERDAVLYRCYKIILYVTITQQQVSLEQGQFMLQRDDWCQRS